ncbi:hypothetical protein AYO40_01635 [Planctomycetaceae bacterium SCGC AG-212-D15]|nr:hypothetical protein AYO40_01635 [Planctomycetaceae bacterium SCGC AG-212-D15]
MVDGRAYTVVERGGDEVVIALDAATGKEIWSKRIGDGRTPSSTPTVHANRLYVQSENVPGAGMAVSPLIEGNLVLTVVGGALNRATGEPLWTTAEKNKGFEFSSPVIVRVGDKSQAVFVTGSELVAVQPDDGKVLWRFPWVYCEGDAATPLVIGRHLFVSSGGCALVAPAVSGDPKVVWKTDGVMDNYWATAVCDGQHLYGISGGHGSKPNLNCVEMTTGKLVWSRKTFGWANLTLADSHLYILTVKGELVVAAATPKAYQEKSRAIVLGRPDYLNAPAIAGKKLYVRDKKHIICLDLAGN